MRRTLVEAVARGATLLDQKRPGWAAEIDADRLRMSLCDQCVLGQLYGSYFGGKVRLEIGDEAFWFGFNSTGTDYAALTFHWLAQIARRLDGPGAPVAEAPTP